MLKTENIENIISQLVDIYLSNEEYWHKNKLPRQESERYFDCLLKKGNIIYYMQNEELVGYVEFWRINYEQMGRLLCKEVFLPMEENINDGKICYLSNTWIKPECRMTNVARLLKVQFFKHNFRCEYFIGEALRKPHAPVKVFKRADLMSKLYKEGE